MLIYAASIISSGSSVLTVVQVFYAGYRAQGLGLTQGLGCSARGLDLRRYMGSEV